jgi:hypothetical protein
VAHLGLEHARPIQPERVAVVGRRRAREIDALDLVMIDKRRRVFYARARRERTRRAECGAAGPPDLLAAG